MQVTVTEKDLFLAILAMDAYNRGRGAGLNDEGASDSNGLGSIGSGIGTATVTAEADTALDSAAVAAGFYAVAYQTQYGTVISYRGSDNLALSGSEAGASDVYTGWVQGGGRPAGQLIRVGR
jgi:hypothetical protein